MHAYTADALVLRSYRYGEADRIVVFLTEDRGKKRGVAKNATASRRRFGAALEPLTRGRATYVEHEHRELVRLERVEATQSPLRATSRRADGDAALALGYAAYFAELLDEWAPDNAANERLFRLGAAVGRALEHAGSTDALARYFEYWLMRLEGVYPAMDRCPVCGQQTLADGAVFVAKERAYHCRGCARFGLRLSGDALEFLRHAGARTPVEVTGGGAPAGALRELEQAHHELITMHLDKRLRSARVIRELGPAS
jgi:DNA repair protein RecO (recombination protein O)